MDITHIQQITTLSISTITMVFVVINFFYQKKRISDLQDKLLESNSFVQLAKDINDLKDISGIKEYVSLKTETFQIKIDKINDENNRLKNFILTLEEKAIQNNYLRYININELEKFVSAQMTEMVKLASHPGKLSSRPLFDFYTKLLDNIINQVKNDHNSLLK